MNRDRVVKLKDIADAAGVAVATVSAALNGTGTVSNAMRERVRKVAAEMNYEPNMAAKLLKQKRSRDLGLIVSDLPERNTTTRLPQRFPRFWSTVSPAVCFTEEPSLRPCGNFWRRIRIFLSSPSKRNPDTICSPITSSPSTRRSST